MSSFDAFRPTTPRRDIYAGLGDLQVSGAHLGGPPLILGHRGAPREAPENTLAGLRRALVAAHPHMGRIDTVPANVWVAEPLGKMSKGAFGPAVADFYLTNPIARASSLMAELSANAKARRTEALAAE